jgi:Protein of unknown function (DUF3050)
MCVRLAECLKELASHQGVRGFVTETLDCAMHGAIVEVASLFFFGREDVIPEMFERLAEIVGQCQATSPALLLLPQTSH